MNDLFVIVEWNQAGGLPQIADTDVHTRLEDAVADAAWRTEQAAPRRDRYEVARLELLSDEEDA